MKFDPFKDNFSLPKTEERVISFWREHRIFEKSNEMASDRPRFVFYEGPPTANGRPGIHHLMARTIKDIICRYKYMQGFRVDRKGGWDTHGLPVEIEVEKELGLKGRDQVEEYGIARYNAACRKSVLKYKELWDQFTERIGYWVDLETPYITFQNEYIESVWALLKQIYDKDLLYKSYKIQWYSPSSGTVLSSHEVSLGYKEVQDPSVFVRFKVQGEGNVFFLAWTTTPWTLISNAGLAVGADITYVRIRGEFGTDEPQDLILAQDRLSVINEEYEVVERYTGKDLIGKRYEPLFDYFVNDVADGDAWYVVEADFVSTEDGTGVVHMAPAFGAEDFEVSKRTGLPVLNPIQPDGVFGRKATLVADDWFKDADKKICRDLKERGLMYRQETYLHNYPHDWRKHTPLMSYPVEGWFIRTTAIKDRLIDLNKSINWVPSHIGSGRFGEWLENNVDWALSRRRFWGTPLPIWQSDKEGSEYTECIGSIAELREKAGDQLTSAESLDLHRPSVDELTWPAPDGGTMRRVPDLIDVWFDSGAMPFAQWHVPFENQEEWKLNFPADFIAEGFEQTRGWFYTLHAIAALIEDSVSYKNVLVNGLLLDEQGEKMSKSRGNTVDPFETVDRYGADPTRWYLMSASNPWLNICFDFDRLKEVIRKYFDTLRNTWSFFAIYANIDNILERAEADGQAVGEFFEAKAGPAEPFDRWIASRFNSTAKIASEALDAYDLTRAIRAVQEFVIEDLSNWYVRNNRRRFWAEGDDPSKMRAYACLHRMLEGVLRLAAPFSPMISEAIWHELTGPNREQHGLLPSLHLTPYPEVNENAVDSVLEVTMGAARKIVSLGRAARARHNLKVRQPLSRILIALGGTARSDRLEEYLDIIRDELNIKRVEFADSLADRVSYSAKLNFKAAGPKLSGKVKQVAPLVQQLDSAGAKAFADSGSLSLSVDGEAVALDLDDVEIIRHEKEGFAVESDGPLTVALITALDDELLDEGFARETVNKIQNMRKTSGLEVTDRIAVLMKPTDRLKIALEAHQEFICRETLAERLDFSDSVNGDDARTWNINGEEAVISVAKI
jgi:isoleucyl-tRNA synthetase